MILFKNIKNFINLIFLYINTLKYMKISQVIYRIYYRLRISKDLPYKEVPQKRTPNNYVKIGILKKDDTYNPDLNFFLFLNKKKYNTQPIDWNPKGMTRLWVYNLHYFDFINSGELSSRQMDVEYIIDSWIDNNNSLKGPGWEPYPVSLRIVNWIKFFLNYKFKKDIYIESLYLQLRYLSKNIEYHIMGNHIIANAKALIFGGIFFDDSKSNNFRLLGENIFTKQINEQILKDGAHFELSPMYHQVILEDIIDLIHIYNAYNIKVPSLWNKKLAAMQNWSTAMSHPDGDISFFNDSAFSIARKPEETEKECIDIGIPIDKQNFLIQHFEDSGYVIFKNHNIKMIIDSGVIGPNYIPGHGHSDLYSFELSIFGKRLVVNGGTSTYEISEKRGFERSSASHSTIEIDGNNSSEVWSSFRVARRSKPSIAKVLKNQNNIQISSTNTDFRNLYRKIRNTRTWNIKNNEIIIKDKLEGPYKTAKTKIILHPDWTCKKINDQLIYIYCEMLNKRVKVESLEPINIRQASYSSEFGKSQRTTCLTQNSISNNMQLIISW